jgi:hypothetical protein
MVFLLDSILTGITSKYTGGQDNLFCWVEDESNGGGGSMVFIFTHIMVNSENLKGPESSKVREKGRSLTRTAHPFSTHHPFPIQIFNRR